MQRLESPTGSEVLGFVKQTVLIWQVLLNVIRLDPVEGSNEGWIQNPAETWPTVAHGFLKKLVCFNCQVTFDFIPTNKPYIHVSVPENQANSLKSVKTLYVIISNIFLENRNFTNNKGEFIPWSSILPIPPNPPCFGDCEAWKEHLPAENHWQTSVGIGRSSYHFQQKYILQSYRFTILLNNNSPIEKTHEHATSQKNTSILFKFRFKIRETVLLTLNFRIFLQPVSLFYPLLHSAMLPLVVAILTQRIDSRH